jgi:DNA polymerase-3 subunit gamma/tau
MIKAFNIAATDLRGGWQPSLPLEMALAEVLETPKPPIQKSEEPKVLFQKRSPDNPEKALVKEKAEKPIQKEAEKVRSTPPAQAGSSATLEQVSKAWKQIKESLHSQQSLTALLNSSRLVEIKDGVLVLGFASEVLRSKMETPEQLELTRKAITQFTGFDLRLRCVISNAKQSAPPDIKADGMVAAALKKGGEIVDIQE